MNKDIKIWSAVARLLYRKHPDDIRIESKSGPTTVVMPNLFPGNQFIITGKDYFFVSSVDGLTQCRNGLVCGIWKFKAWKGQIM